MACSRRSLPPLGAFLKKCRGLSIARPLFIVNPRQSADWRGNLPHKMPCQPAAVLSYTDKKVPKEPARGSDATAACGGKREQSEWQRSAENKSALADVGFAGNRNRRHGTCPVGTLDVLLADGAAASPIGPCHSFGSLLPPLAALPSFPPPGPRRYRVTIRFFVGWGLRMSD